MGKSIQTVTQSKLVVFPLTGSSLLSDRKEVIPVIASLRPEIEDRPLAFSFDGRFKVENRKARFDPAFIEIDPGFIFMPGPGGSKFDFGSDIGFNDRFDKRIFSRMACQPVITRSGVKVKVTGHLVHIDRTESARRRYDPLAGSLQHL